MHHDDEQVGQILTRREVLGLIGAGGAAMLGGASPAAASERPPFRLPACIVRPRQTEGPYFVDEMLERSDIRAEPSDGRIPEGARFDLAFQVSRIGADGCAPLPVEDVIGGLFDTTGKQFLRGYQVTDAEGMARFRTIYPGWYEGRCVHIHFKIRTEPSSDEGHEFTSQVYFDDALTDRVLDGPAYGGREGERPRNEDDDIFRGGGDQLLLDVAEADDGYRAIFDIGLQID
jgi:hypothetical protein